MKIVAFSGGKDSTAMVLRLWELGDEFTMLFTPAGNEPKELFDHITFIADLVKMPLVQPDGPDLFQTIEKNQALPSHRMRFCTRQIKIQPCIEYLKTLEYPELCVGLRADEEEREGLYGPYATYRYPLREWGWGLEDVLGYLADREIKIPSRTNCNLCYGQRIGEWYNLWRDHPGEFSKGVSLESLHGHTFRSPTRDRWPASLVDLAEEFRRGRIPRGADIQQSLFESDKYLACRVCTL